MSLAALKTWVRAQGQKPGQPGCNLLQQNKSYIFFDLAHDLPTESGPIGGAGLPLVALRAIAVDRTLWSYGLPFWLSGDLPWQSDEASPFRRLTIAQDTGSAILGAARADIFFGSGPAAGAYAGAIRHPCDFFVLLPRSGMSIRETLRAALRRGNHALADGDAQHCAPPGCGGARTAAPKARKAGKNRRFACGRPDAL